MDIPIAVVLRAKTPREIQAAAIATFVIDVAQLRDINERRSTPWNLYTSGIQYRREQRKSHFPDVERFQTIRSLIATRWGDCDDLAPAAAAVHFVAGDRRARPLVIRSPGIGWHVITVLGNGNVEDPSARLGMLDHTFEHKLRSRTDAR